jgi:hypothetical protein
MKPRNLIYFLAASLCISILPICSPESAAHGQSSQPGQAKPFEWPSQPPAGIPFSQSNELTGIVFTGRYAQYEFADTWYPSWAADDNLYSNWTDGVVKGLHVGSYDWKPGKLAATGYATVRGSDPMNLDISDVGSYPSDPEPYEGRYPSANLYYRGVWYYGTYCLHATASKHLNWDVLGPFAGFRYSTDHGKTWHQTSHSCGQPLFLEPKRFAAKVKMGAPHIVDFGKEMQYSPDGKAYLVAHGASDPDPNPRAADLSWITGDEIYLARVAPSPATIDDASKYEFFAGLDANGKPVWTHDFAAIKPLLKWDNNMGSVTITYDAPLKKFLMAVTDGGDTVSKFNTYILESPAITGPWKLVTYMKDFGVQAYFVNFPSKFISADGRTAWLSYSANFANEYLPTNYKSIPEGGGYWWTLQEVHLVGQKSPK